MSSLPFLEVAEDLELAGLLWHPEIGDEIADRKDKGNLSILVDPQGMSPSELRSIFIWLPTVEQMVSQLEARQAVLAHAGLELSTVNIGYKTVIQIADRKYECQAGSMRVSIGLALRSLLLGDSPRALN